MYSKSESDYFLNHILVIINELGLGIVPYIVLLLVPVLGAISDRDPSVRLQAAQCFANLVKLAPLDGGKNEKSENGCDDMVLAPELLERKEKEKAFLGQLLDIKQVKDYKIPVPIDATLRTYQQVSVIQLSIPMIYVFPQNEKTY